jgi:hypothetical protein
MRKSSRPLSSKSPKKRVLQLSHETVRTLTTEELVQAVTGCPTTSDPTVQNGGSHTC